MSDWYAYLTIEFRLDRKAYRVASRYPFTCPKCEKSKVERLNHVKDKIKRIGFYACGECRKKESILRAREAFKEKYGNINPFELKASKAKIRATLREKYGVDCVLKLEKVHQKGIMAASERNKQLRGYEADYSQITVKSSENQAEWQKQYCRIRKNKDPHYKAQRAVYTALKRMLKGQTVSATSILKDVGYSPEDLRAHLESLFQPGMSWENHGEWHLDHIIPLSAFNCQDLEEVKKANALSNLQPLWAADNIRKGNKY